MIAMCIYVRDCKGLDLRYVCLIVYLVCLLLMTCLCCYVAIDKTTLYVTVVIYSLVIGTFDCCMVRTKVGCTEVFRVIRNSYNLQELGGLIHNDQCYYTFIFAHT